MSPLVWLAVAVIAGGAAWVVASPAFHGRRAREERDLNAERYLAWRGRARPQSPSSAAARMTASERGRLVGGGVLAAVALGALVAFFATS